MPFKPSTAGKHPRPPHAVLNLVTDTRVFAGCVTGRRAWPTLPAERIPACASPPRCATSSCAWPSLSTMRSARCCSRRVLAGQPRPLRRPEPRAGRGGGGAVLVSRLHMLAAEKIAAEMAYCRSPSTRPPAPASTRPGAGCGRPWRRTTEEAGPAAMIAPWSACAASTGAHRGSRRGRCRLHRPEGSRGRRARRAAGGDDPPSSRRCAAGRPLPISATIGDDVPMRTGRSSRACRRSAVRRRHREGRHRTQPMPARAARNRLAACGRAGGAGVHRRPGPGRARWRSRCARLPRP